MRGARWQVRKIQPLFIYEQIEISIEATPQVRREAGKRDEIGGHETRRRSPVSYSLCGERGGYPDFIGPELQEVEVCEVVHILNATDAIAGQVELLQGWGGCTHAAQGGDGVVRQVEVSQVAEGGEGRDAGEAVVAQNEFLRSARVARRGGGVRGMRHAGWRAGCTGGRRAP